MTNIESALLLAACAGVIIIIILVVAWRSQIVSFDGLFFGTIVIVVFCFIVAVGVATYLDSFTTGSLETALEKVFRDISKIGRSN